MYDQNILFTVSFIINLENFRNIDIRNINFLNEEAEKEDVQIHVNKQYIWDDQNLFQFYNEWELEGFVFQNPQLRFEYQC